MIVHNIKRFWCGYTGFADELGKETLQQSVKVKVMTYAKLTSSFAICSMMKQGGPRCAAR
jgi:hypothetical protein